MNQTLSKLGALITTITVALFALFIIMDFTFGSYFVCMILPIGYVMTAAGFAHECDDDRKVAANIGITFAAVYMTLILLVYFSQTTSVTLENLNEQAQRILDYKNGGLMFNYDLLGYGIMALSTFFIGLTVKPENKKDKWLKALLMIHGVFFLSCFIMPMTGMFLSMADGDGGNSGSIALLFWCLYFLPIGVLSVYHFNNEESKD